MTSSLIGYAVLRANYNANAGSYLDNFSGFVLDALSASAPKRLQRSDIASDIREEYGLSIPDLVVGQILRRLRKQNLVQEIGQDYFTASAEGLSRAPALRTLATSFKAQQAELEFHFRAYVEAHLPEHLDLMQKDVGAALHAYFERHAIPLLSRSIKGAPLRLVPEMGFEYLISSYVAHLADTDQARFKYVVEASKGAILAAVLDLDTSGFKDSLQGLKIFFDTPVVINALGFAGEVLQKAATQTIDLARSQGAHVALFTHSVKEIRGILNGAQNSLRAGSRSLSTSAVYLHFVESGYSAVDVMEIEDSLEERIAELRLSIDGKPANYSSYGLDEGRLENQLQDVIHYREAATRLYDVDSVSAIHRLREGSVPQKFEKAKALFVTSNSALVRAAREFSAKDQRAKFPLVLHDTAAAAILWVRSASMEDDVPREQLLATAYASMQPSPTLWARYLDEVDLLEARAEVTQDEAAILRASTVARSALMDETLGDGEALGADLPLQVLARVKSEIETPLREQIDKVEKAHARTVVASMENLEAAGEEAVRRKSLESDLQELQSQFDASEKAARDLRQSQLRTLRDGIESSTRLLVRVPLGAVFALILGYAFVVAFQSLTGADVKSSWWLAAVLSAIAVMGLVPQFFPGTVMEWLRPFEHKIVEWRFARNCRRLGLDATEYAAMQNRTTAAV